MKNLKEKEQKHEEHKLSHTNEEHLKKEHQTHPASEKLKMPPKKKYKGNLHEQKKQVEEELAELKITLEKLKNQGKNVYIEENKIKKTNADLNLAEDDEKELKKIKEDIGKIRKEMEKLI